MQSLTSNLIKNLPKITGKYTEKFPLGRFTWLKTGGEAEVLFEPKDEDDLKQFLKNVNKEIGINIVGAGSNLLVRDGGVPGVTIMLTSSYFNQIKKIGSMDFFVRSGLLLSKVSNFCTSNSIGGFEFFSQIPGTVGGALKMNAGAYNSSTYERLTSLRAIDLNGNVHCISVDNIKYGYREACLPSDWIFLDGWFSGVLSNEDKIKEKVNFLKEKRMKTQLVFAKTAGSTFKNPQCTNKSAWQLIDGAGCRNMTLDGAKVSEKHCNFLVNENARANILEYLGKIIHKKCLIKYSISLEWEIVRIGMES